MNYVRQLEAQLAAGEAREAALQRERDREKARTDIVIAEFDAPWPHSHTVEEVLRDPLIRQIHECRAGTENRADAAEAAIVSLQADLDDWKTRFRREALDHIETRALWSDLQAQIQAITQEMREKAAECTCPCHREHDNLCLECCDGGAAKWADRIAALGNGE